MEEVRCLLSEIFGNPCRRAGSPATGREVHLRLGLDRLMPGHPDSPLRTDPEVECTARLFDTTIGDPHRTTGKDIWLLVCKDEQVWAYADERFRIYVEEWFMRMRGFVCIWMYGFRFIWMSGFEFIW